MSDNIGSVSVEVVPDARGFPEKLKAKLSGLDVKVGVNLDTGKAKAELDRLAARSRTATINANADTAAAAAKLDELARTRSATIRANVDRSSFARAESAAGGAARKVSLLETAVVGLGPALIPATAALAGFAAAMAAPVFAAGAGLGIFGVIESTAIAKTVKDTKTIEASQKKVTELRAQEAKYTAKAQAASGKTAVNYRKQAADYAKQAQAQQKLVDQQTAQLPKGERALMASTDRIRKVYGTLLHAHSEAVFGPLVQGANLISQVLPKTGPILDHFGGAVVGVEKSLSRWVGSEQFTHLVQFIDRQGVPAFESFVHIAGNVAAGIGSIVRASAPLGRGVLRNLEGASKGFRDIGDSKGFQSFLAYVRDEGPHVAHVLGDLAVAGVKVLHVLAPQGGLVLTVLDDIATFVVRAKPSQIAAIAGAVGALGLATGKLSPLRGLVLISTAVAYAYNHSSAFRELADDAGRLAGALNKLPTGIKVAGALGLGALALKSGALRGGLGGGLSGGGGLVGRVLGAAKPVPVFITNPGFGLPGGKGGGELPFIAAGPGGKHAAPKGVGKGGALGLLTSFPLPALGDIGAETRDLGGQPLAKKYQALAKSFGDVDRNALQFTHTILRVDTSLATLAQNHPDQALRKLQAASRDSGLSMADLGKILPKTSDAFGGLADKSNGAKQALAAAGIGTHKLGLTMSDMRFEAGRAGISAGQLGKAMRTLPVAVRTKILTPGALESKKSIRDLGKQFGLTPKQIQTVVKLVGVRDAQDKTKSTQKGLRTLNQTTAKPKVVAQGTEVANAKIKGVDKNLLTVNQRNAKPHVTPQGTETANAKIKGVDKTLLFLNQQSAKPKVTVLADTSGASRAQAAINAIHGKTVDIYIAATHAANVRSEIASIHGHAAGGIIAGPGTGTSDSILMRASKGEFVVNAAATARHRAILEAINAQRYAAGGMVTSAGQSASPADGGVNVNYHGPVYAVDPDMWGRKQARRAAAALAVATAP